MLQPVLQCVNLTKYYDKTPALNDVSFAVPTGRIVGLLGPNASGKTTLIKLAAGLLTPSSGKIYVNGYEPGETTKAMVSYLPERPYFDKSMKVIQAVSFFADFYRDFDRARAVQLLERLGVNPERQIKTLSKGTQEKVQLVLVMSRRAALYLLDEPIGGVDPAARDFILQTVISCYEPTATILISTHLIADVEKILDDFLFISAGKVFMQGSVKEVTEQKQKSLDELFREVFRC